MDSPPMKQSIQLAQNVRDTINQDGAVLLDIKQGVCFSVNPVGARIWQMLKDRYPVDQIAASLESEFKVPRSQIETDISDFLQSLRESKLLQREDEVRSPRRPWFRRIFS